jgi:hypothetical protein
MFIIGGKPGLITGNIGFISELVLAYHFCQLELLFFVSGRFFGVLLVTFKFMNLHFSMKHFFVLVMIL